MAKYIYIAGAYTRNTDEGVREAIDAMHAILDAGHVPYCPHLSFLGELRRHRPYNDWLRLGLAWVERCDLLLRLPGESKGADAEELYARKLGKPVIYGLQTLVVLLDAKRVSEVRE